MLTVRISVYRRNAVVLVKTDEVLNYGRWGR
jgi:hypothetical protein